MRIIMLGTGAALCDPDRNHSSILITVRGRNYLFDCGHGATHQLMRAGVDPVSIDVVVPVAPTFRSHRRLSLFHADDLDLRPAYRAGRHRSAGNREIRRPPVRGWRVCQGHPGARAISTAPEEFQCAATGRARMQAGTWSLRMIW